MIKKTLWIITISIIFISININTTVNAQVRIIRIGNQWQAQTESEQLKQTQIETEPTIINNPSNITLIAIGRDSRNNGGGTISEDISNNASTITSADIKPTNSSTQSNSNGFTLYIRRTSNKITLTPQKTYSSGFKPGNTISDEYLYDLPDQFNSAEAINNYLKEKGSFLADYDVEISFEDDDDILTMGNKDRFDPAVNLQPYFGTKIRFADMIWKMSQTKFGNACSLYTKGACIDMEKTPINPAFVLAMIQRESGLIYGTNAKLNPESDRAKFLLDRATGYTCFEVTDKSKTCYDENPNWKYFKGLFRQTFYMMRNLTINAKKCEIEGVKIGSNYFRVNYNVNISNQIFELENGMTCALYIYTPHVFAQESVYKVTQDLK